jgi:hypothetical protein
MRRLAALALAALAVSACSGEQGERAQQLLTRAQAAQSKLRSATFEARVELTTDGQRFSLVMDGGGYLKGPRTGDTVFSMRTDGVPGGGRFSLQAVARQGRLSMTMNGQRLSLPTTGTSASQAQALDWSGTVLDVARYVRKVRVREGRVLNGERGATLAGVIDTKELLKAISRLDAFTSAARIDDLSGKVGDIHAAVFVGERSGLIRSAVVTMSIEAEGKKAELELSYRLASTNKAVAGL